MAKFKSKIAKNKDKQNDTKKIQSFQQLKGRMQTLVEQEMYVDAMDVMAEIANVGKVDAEVMYLGALCYYRTADYMRAAKWLNNALTYKADSCQAKVLLGAVCLAQNRVQDGLKIFEHVLTNYKAGLNAKDEAIMAEILQYYQHNDCSELDEYPQVAAYVQELLPADSCGEKAVSTTTQVVPPAESDAKAALARLRAMLNKNRPTMNQPKDITTEKTEHQPVQPVSKLPPKPVEQPQIAKYIMSNNVAQPEDSKPVQENKLQILPEAMEQNKFDVNATLEAVMSKEVSLKDKVKLLNTFAGACYQNEDFQSAFDLLSAALQIDVEDAIILKNLAYVCLAAGEKEQAEEFAAKLPMVDFALLHAIRKG